MSKSILISIKPQFVEKILNGEKTIEIRKTMPKCELPVRVYIYCTHSKVMLANKRKAFNFLEKKLEDKYACFYTIAGRKYSTKDISGSSLPYVNGKVVGEFTLNKVETIKENQIYNAKVMLEHACLTIEELNNYTKGKKFYAWHIDDLEIYDKPKELSELGISKAPQSWCYVKNVKEY